MFWRSTPGEIALIAEGITRRRQREHDERMSLAWHVAALGRWPARRRFPQLRSLTVQRRRVASVPVETQYQWARLWTIALGGTVPESKPRE